MRLTWKYRGNAVSAAAIEVFQGQLNRTQRRGRALVENMKFSCIAAGVFEFPADNGKRKYQISLDQRNCRCRKLCKHQVAIAILYRYAVLLANRLGKSLNPPALNRSGTSVISDIREMEQMYFRILDENPTIKSEDPGFLCNLRVAATDAEDYAEWKMQTRLGVSRVPHGFRPRSPWMAKLLGFCELHEFNREFVDGKWDYSEIQEDGTGVIWVYFHFTNGIYQIFDPADGGRRWFIDVRDSQIMDIGCDEVRIRLMAKAD